MIDVGMELGTVNTEVSTRAIMFVDPFAEAPPDDRKEVTEAGQALALAPYDEGIAYVQAWTSGNAPNPLEDIFAFGAERQLTQAVDAMYSALQAAGDQSPSARDDAIMAALAGEKQRMLNLIIAAVRAAQEQRDLPHIDAIAGVLLKKDAQRPYGLSRETNALLQVVTFGVVRLVRGHVIHRTLTREILRELLASVEGRKVAGEAVARVLLSGYGARWPSDLRP